MIWPFKRKIETRAAMGVTLDYMDHRRKQALTDAGVNLTATTGTALHYWQSGFAMLSDESATLGADTLAAIGRDLCMRGESCWHIRADGSALDLVPVAYWSTSPPVWTSASKSLRPWVTTSRRTRPKTPLWWLSLIHI